MNSLENMYTLLKPTGLYRLDGESLVSHELSAYAAALDFMERRLGEMLEACFIATAGEDGLESFEKLFGLRGHGTLAYDDRRNMLLSMYALPGEDSTKQGITDALRGIGLYADIEENPAEERLYIACHEYHGRFINHNMLALRAESVLPAHLAATLSFDFFTWDMAEGYELSFDGWDYPDYTFDQLENLGNRIIEIE